MEGINHELPAPLESEFAEIAWGIPKSGEKHAPIWIARPKVTGKFEVKVIYFHFCLPLIKDFERKFFMTILPSINTFLCQIFREKW